MTQTASAITNILPAPCRPPRLRDCNNESLLRYFDTTWELSDALMRSITGPETFYRVADPLRHPLVFYLGHTAAFYINKLMLAGELDSVNGPFEELFAMGVDPSSPEYLQTFDWPALKSVWRYRRQVRRCVRDWIEGTRWRGPIDRQSPLWALLMGMEHDLIHFETSSVLIRQYPEDELTRPANWRYAPLDEQAPPREWVYLPADRVTLGRPAALDTYGWDNEFGHRLCEVPAFEASNLLVTNEDFTQFVAADGYERPELWTDEGWRWVQAACVRHPTFWIQEDREYRYRAMFDVLALPLHWPVEVNYHEASAYCRFLGEGARLPTEAEFRRISDEVQPDGGDLVFTDDFNLNLCYGSPCAVGSLATAASPRGIQDIQGNVWCWLADDFNALPGFRTHPWYDDFSKPFFTPDHAMLLGGSWASLGTSASRYYRLWFRRQFIQHAGFRVVRDLDGPSLP